MKAFIAGATGAIGRSLVPALIARGYTVVGMTRSPEKAATLRSQGAESVVADLLDRDAVIKAIEKSAPDVVVHQVTDLSRVANLRKFDAEFASTNLLRTKGTDNLLAGARAAGARRFIAQSFGGWIYERTGTALKTEEDRLDPHPPRMQRKTLDAIQYLDETVAGATDIQGLSLRYGNFYGPGTGLAIDGNLAEMVRQRKLPIVGTGAGVWSLIHIDDAASATIAAIERGAPGIYNIADDEPAPIAEWLPEFASAIGAKPPLRVPVWVGRLMGGEVGVSIMTQIRGMSNAKARRELGWEPSYKSWREGFRIGLGAAIEMKAT